MMGSFIGPFAGPFETCLDAFLRLHALAKEGKSLTAEADAIRARISVPLSSEQDQYLVSLYKLLEYGVRLVEKERGSTLISDEVWQLFRESSKAKMEHEDTRAACREKCEGLCYRCIEYSYLELIQALVGNVSIQEGISDQLALKLAALVYKGVYEGLVDDGGYECTENEAKTFAAVQELIEAN